MKQEAFNKVWHALTKQGAPSTDADSGKCLYNGPNHTHCAIGHLVPEELHANLVESATIMQQLPEMRNWLYDHCGDQRFLLELQRAHDQATCGDFWVEAFQARMLGIAEEYNLTVPDNG